MKMCIYSANIPNVLPADTSSSNMELAYSQIRADDSLISRHNMRIVLNTGQCAVKGLIDDKRCSITLHMQLYYVYSLKRIS